MKTKSLFFLLFLLAIPNLAGATVYFYTGYNCKGHWFSKEPGSIRDLKTKTYIGKCTRYAGRDREIDYEVDCEKTFNDAIYSVEITQGEEVRLFKHKEFEGSVKYLIDGNGCYHLGGMKGEASSVIVYE